MKHSIIALDAIVMVGCANTGGDAAPEAVAPLPECAPMMGNAAPVQHHVGHDATQTMGAAIMKDSGARTLRLPPPRTTDYRQDRVNVQHDENMKIVKITWR